jgi:hypothetical protein
MGRPPAERVAVPDRFRVHAVRQVVEVCRRHDPETQLVLSKVDVEALTGSVSVRNPFKGGECSSEPAQVVGEARAGS